jgi:hypothetical protein
MQFLGANFAAAITLATASAVAAPTGYLNDTAQTSCYDSSTTPVACGRNHIVGTDADAHPRQDARFGRDVMAAAGMLSKVGGGAAGFDFTKVCANGDLAGQGTCAADPQTTDANPWACTKDNHTNLIWSLQTFDPIDWRTAASGDPGAPIDNHNSASRCDLSSGWRLPSRRELLSLIHRNGAQPAIDSDYFPYTPSLTYWTNDAYANSWNYNSELDVWIVDFFDGNVYWAWVNNANLVRLVHDGP